jgi:hypothetical protein
LPITLCMNVIAGGNGKQNPRLGKEGMREHGQTQILFTTKQVPGSQTAASSLYLPQHYPYQVIMRLKGRRISRSSTVHTADCPCINTTGRSRTYSSPYLSTLTTTNLNSLQLQHQQYIKVHSIAKMPKSSQSSDQPVKKEPPALPQGGGQTQNSPDPNYQEPQKKKTKSNANNSGPMEKN